MKKIIVSSLLLSFSVFAMAESNTGSSSLPPAGKHTCSLTTGMTYSDGTTVLRTTEIYALSPKDAAERFVNAANTSVVMVGGTKKYSVEDVSCEYSGD